LPTSFLRFALTFHREYYFSVENMIKDVYMRKHMDSQGFILLSFIADFKRLKSMTTDLELIKFVCQQSANIEHRIGPDGLDRLRMYAGWEQWVMPMSDRDPSAQNDGPTVLHTPPPPQLQTYQPRDQMRQASLPTSNTSGAPMSAPPVPYQSLNGFAASYGNFGPHSMNDNHNFQTSPSSATNEAAPMVQPPGPQLASPPASQADLANGAVEHEPDAYSDEEVNHTLRIIVRQPEPNAVMTPSAPVRSFSNGSLDGANIAEEIGNPAIASAAPLGGTTAASE
jgi:la-related protein 1